MNLWNRLTYKAPTWNAPRVYAARIALAVVFGLIFWWQRGFYGL